MFSYHKRTKEWIIATFLLLLMTSVISFSQQKNIKKDTPCSYNSHNDFHEGLEWVVKGNKTSYYDISGKEMIPSQYDEYGDFYDGLARVEKNGMWGYIDKTGKEIVPCSYDWA